MSSFIENIFTCSFQQTGISFNIFLQNTFQLILCYVFRNELQLELYILLFKMIRFQANVYTTLNLATKLSLL
jgi:hypothetical protein